MNTQRTAAVPAADVTASRRHPSAGGTPARQPARRRRSTTLLLAVLALTLAACATVQHGPVQGINVDSEPTGAKVRTDLCGPGATKEVHTPGVVWVSRRAERCTLTFTADGYIGKRVVLTRALSPEFLENVEAIDVCGDGDCDTGWFLLSSLVAGTGIGIDAITGALYEQQPADVFVSLPLHDDGDLDEEPEDP